MNSGGWVVKCLDQHARVHAYVHLYTGYTYIGKIGKKTNRNLV